MALGSIVIELLMRTGAFETDTKRAAKAAEKMSKQISVAAIAAGTALGNALYNGASKLAGAFPAVIDRMDDMSKAAQKVGLPTEEFSKLTYAAGLADVEMETLVTTLGKLTKAQGSALDATSKQADLFKALQIDAIDPLTGAMRNSSDVLADFADRFKEAEGSPEMMTAGFELFGRSFQNIIPLLKDGGDGIRAAGDELQRLGGVLSTEAGAQAELFNDNITRLQTAAGGLAVALLADLLPRLNELTGSMVEFSAQGGQAESISQVIARTFDVVAGSGQVLVGVIRGITVVIAELVNQVTSWYEIVSNISTLGFAPGTVKGGWNRSGLGWQNYEDAQAQNGQTVTNGLSRIWNGSPAADMPSSVGVQVPQESVAEAAARIKAARERNAAIRAALGDEDKPKTGGGGKAKELSAEAKASEDLNRAYENQLATLREKNYLLVNTGEDAQLLWDIEHGALKGLAPARQQELKDLQAKAEAQKLVNDAREEGKRLTEAMMTQEEQAAAEIARAGKLLEQRLITQETYNRVVEANQTPAQQMVADLESEFAMLGMTNKQREIAIALLRAHATASSEDGKKIIEGIEKIQKATEAKAVMDDLRESFTDLAVEAAMNWDKAGDAFEAFADRMKRRAIALLAEKAIQWLFSKLFPGSAAANGAEIDGNANGGVFSGGAKLFANGGAFTNTIVSSPTLFKFGTGGQLGMMGEAGPEAIMPLTRGPDGKLGVNAQGVGGGGVNVEVNITNKGKPVEAESSSRMEGGKLIIDMVIAEVDSRIARMGSTGRAISQRYNLQPAGVSRG